MKPSELIDWALTERISDASRWGKGHFYRQGKYCLRGSLMGTDWRNLDGYLVEDMAIHAVLGVIREQYGSLTCLVTGEVGIALFNDAPDRTYDEVRAVMEKARANLAEQGQ